MTKRDLILLIASLTLLVALCSPLLFHAGAIPGNFGDIYSYHYPLRHLVASTLQEGRLPLWNPYIFAGTPLAANPQAVLFYPPSLLHYFLPLNYAFSLDAFFHLLMAGLGAYLLLRFWSVDSLGAWALSTAYGLSPFLVCRIAQGVPTHLAALGWVPWVWLAAEQSSPLFLSVILSLQVLSGHPQFSLINLAGIGLWHLLKRPANISILISAGAMAVFLAAAQIFPTLEFLKHSVRAHWTSQYALGYSLKPSYLLTLLSPNMFGNPLQPGFSEFPSSFFEMLRLYIGVIPLALGLCGLTAPLASLLSPKGRGSKKIIPSPLGRTKGMGFNGLWLLIGAGLFFALGQNNPLYTPFEKLFRLDFLRVPARFSFLILWGLWMAAAAGWIGLRRALPKSASWWRMALAAGTVLDLAFWSVPWIYAQRPRDFLSPNTELLTFLRSTPPPPLSPEVRGAAIWRIATSPDVPAPNKSMLYRIPDATGYEAFYLADIAYYTSRSENAPSADGSRTYILNWRTPEMSRLGVRYYLSPSPMTGDSPVFQKKSLYVYENKNALPLVQGAVEWRNPNPEHWTASGTGPATVLFSQAAYPGWKAWVNGEPSTPNLEDGFFPSVTIAKPLTSALSPERGEGRVRRWTLNFRFIPDLWFTSVWITLGTLLFLGILSIRQIPQ